VTDPKDYYPWPRLLPTMQHDYFLLLMKSPRGQSALQKELATRIKKFLIENPWYRDHRPIRMPQVVQEGFSDSNAKEILRIYHFLLQLDGQSYPYSLHNKIGIYYKAFRDALSQLRWDHL